MFTSVVYKAAGVDRIDTVNTGGLVNNIRNRETRFEAGFTVSEFSCRVSSNRSLGFGEFGFESDIRISNRSRPNIHGF